MKRILVLATILISSFTQAQQQEISIDLGDALVMKTLEVTYEYYLNNQSSLGISGLFNFNNASSDLRYNEDSMITPYFRHYFSTNSRWNYFGEIFLGINSGEKNGIEYTDGALGVSVGSKYVSNGGLSVSILGGLGRNMFTNQSYEIVPRFGLNVGYRF